MKVVKTFLDDIERGKLIGNKCNNCGQIMLPPRKFCLKCGKSNLEEIELTGKGKIDVFTVIHVPPPFMKDKAPYVVAIVEMDEGPKIMGRLIDINPEEPEKIKSGMKVEFRSLEENDKKVVAFKAID
ncbi:transcriptional regulator [Thermococci archaeon]|nr:MAG: transcriptional regulator [Thermoplasmata archaeon]RLG01718.1 MAG: transcriptional regulator [Thermococci archaeon]